MYADLHVHTVYSKDSRTRVEDAIKYARHKGIHCIAITDHNTIKGAKKAIDVARDIIVVVGEEIQTDIGEVNGLFLQEEIPPGNIFEVLDAIKAQSGISVLNHYGRTKKKIDSEVLAKIDAIETFNGRCNLHENLIAKKLNEKIRKTQIASSDAHIPCYIGCGFIETTDFSTVEELRKILVRGIVKTHEKYPSVGMIFADRFFHFIYSEHKCQKMLKLPSKIIQFLKY